MATVTGKPCCTAHDRKQAVFSEQSFALLEIYVRSDVTAQHAAYKRHLRANQP
jgi:hypothetical protein